MEKGKVILRKMAGFGFLQVGEERYLELLEVLMVVLIGMYSILTEDM